MDSERILDLSFLRSIVRLCRSMEEQAESLDVVRRVKIQQECRRVSSDAAAKISAMEQRTLFARDEKR